MKRIALRTTAALLSVAALTSTASASGYMVAYGRSEQTAPTAESKDVRTERASSGYLITWGKSAQTERASSGYLVSWGKSAE